MNTKMKIINVGLKKAYLINKTSTGVYSICRILNEYHSEENAIEDISKLLSGNINEKDLLKEFSKK